MLIGLSCFWEPQVKQFEIDLFSGPGEVLPPLSADSTSRRVPFGKYRNQPFEVLLADSDYALWLLNSAKAKLESQSPALLTLLLARYGVPDCTPAHNRLQNRFLDNQFALQFALAASESVRAIAETLNHLDLHADWRRYVEDEHTKELSRWKDVSHTSAKQSLAKRQGGLEETANSVQLYARTGTLEGSTWVHPVGIWSLEFEQKGADVAFNVGCGCSLEASIGPAPEGAFAAYVIEPATDTWHRGYGGKDSFRIEVKPHVGDDYPSVLRAMKVVNAKHLLVDDYSGQGASWNEVVKVFALSGITAVRLQDVERVVVPDTFDRVNLTPLTPSSALAIVREVFGGEFDG